MLLDYWFWTYKDPVAGQRRTTAWRMTAVEVKVYASAQRVPGTLQVRDSEIDFEDTAPLVFHTEDSQ